nr:hypothetical protein CKG001_06210 [Bdellovibrio sp. CKG001]BFD61942.1 hypothetical protein BdHM001_06230 [Bdellovibrio sp. HM001]
MDLPQKFVNLLVILIPLVVLVSAFFILDYLQKKKKKDVD